MERSPEVEQLAIAWLAGMKAGDAVAVGGLFVENEAATVIGNGAEQWFTGDAYTTKRLDDSLGEHGGIPFEPGSPTGWAAGDTGWFADRVTSSSRPRPSRSPAEPDSRPVAARGPGAAGRGCWSQKAASCCRASDWAQSSRRWAHSWKLLLAASGWRGSPCRKRS